MAAITADRIRGRAGTGAAARQSAVTAALDALDRRKPQERGRRFPIGRWLVLPSFERDGSYEALRDETDS